MTALDWREHPVIPESERPRKPVGEAARKRDARRSRERKQRRAARVTAPAEDPRWKLVWRETTRAGILRVGKNARPALNRLLARYSKVGDPPVLDPSAFPWTWELEKHWEAIRAEAEAVLRERRELPPLRKISPDHDRIDVDDRWKVFFLKGYGYWQRQNCDRCPHTARLVERIPGLETAFFSILEGGKHIPRHRGPSKAILTFHLGLLIPRERERCWIEVDRSLRANWKPGKLIAFDDSYTHEILNDTEEDRVILLLHVRRPLRFPGNWIARSVLSAIRFSPFVQDGLRNHRKWFEDRQPPRGH